MKTTIGNLEVLHSQTLLIPDNCETWLEIRLFNWDVKLKVILVEDKENPKDTRYDIEGVEDYGVLKLKNWNSSLGMSFLEPTEFGITENKKIYFLLVGHKIGTVTKLDIQFYVESQNEQ